VTTVITAVYGGWERAVPDLSHQTVAPDRQILVTDDAAFGEICAPGWEVIVEPRPHLGPNAAAKIPKCRPYVYAPDERHVIWMDASTIPGPPLIERTLAALEHAWIAQFPHPLRDCIHDEAEASVGIPKYHGQLMREQVACYEKIGFPRHWGLWATGVIGWSPFAAAEIGSDWLVQIMHWSMQDQLSQPFLLWRKGVGKPAPIARDLWCDPEGLVWFREHGT
jgi:hypothetical protein